MPGNIPAASPSGTFPSILYRAFSEFRTYEVQVNEYRNGESQQRNQVTGSRKLWQFAARLTPADLATLRTFYNAHPRTAPFYFTPLDGVQRTARFNCPWSQQSSMGLCEVSLELIEVG